MSIKDVPSAVFYPSEAPSRMAPRFVRRFLVLPCQVIQAFFLCAWQRKSWAQFHAILKAYLWRANLTEDDMENPVIRSYVSILEGGGEIASGSFLLGEDVSFTDQGGRNRSGEIRRIYDDGRLLVASGPHLRLHFVIHPEAARRIAA